MKTTSLLAAAVLGASAWPISAQVILSTEHVDIGVNYADDAWDLHIHDETNDAEYEPGDAVLRVNGNAQTTVSADPQFSFLGPAGSPTWILPNTQDPNLLFLGIGAEELQPGLLVGDRVDLRLQSVTGPGHFAVFDYDSFGNPVVIMNSRDGLSGADSFGAIAGSHSDLNWAFSQPGDYTINFEASGTLMNGSLFTSSGPVPYSFTVIPEPGTNVLLAAGFLAGAFLYRRLRA